MGYYTRYTVTIDDPSLHSAIEKDINCLEYFGGYGHFHLAEATDDTTWYDHETDLQTISKKYPHVTFEVNGEGEEADDIWRMFVKNGKSYKDEIEIKFPPFDESRLK